MTDQTIRILCVGQDARLLETRCAVLKHNGFHTEYGSFAEHEQDIFQGRYGIVIVSSDIGPVIRERMLEVPATTKTLHVLTLTNPEELISKIKALLPTSGTSEG